MTPTSEKILLSSIDLSFPRPHVAVLAIDRPPVNALSRDARREIIAALDDLGERDDVRAIVLTGRGRVFCAGADIKEKAELSEQGANQTAANRLTRDLFFSLLQSPKPIIAAVNGPALGAGFVLVACCDVVVAADSATFAMPEIDVGQGGGASFLQRIMPRMLMRKMMLTGERVPAAELHRVGVVDRCVPAAELEGAALDLAATIAGKSPTAVRTIRDAFLTVEQLPIAEAFRIEQRYTTELSTSEDGAEARRAFMEKRPPRF